MNASEQKQAGGLKSVPWKLLIGIGIGAAGGFLYYYFVGCVTGTCPITSNPYISVLYGAVMGGIVSRL